MIPIITAIIGAIIGWLRSARRGGALLDKLQYGAAHGIAFGLLGLVASIIYIRMSM